MKTLFYSLAVVTSLAGPALTRLAQEGTEPTAPPANALPTLARLFSERPAPAAPAAEPARPAQPAPAAEPAPAAQEERVVEVVGVPIAPSAQEPWLEPDAIARLQAAIEKLAGREPELAEQLEAVREELQARLGKNVRIGRLAPDRLEVELRELEELEQLPVLGFELDDLDFPEIEVEVDEIEVPDLVFELEDIEFPDFEWNDEDEDEVIVIREGQLVEAPEGVYVIQGRDAEQEDERLIVRLQQAREKLAREGEQSRVRAHGFRLQAEELRAQAESLRARALARVHGDDGAHGDEQSHGHVVLRENLRFAEKMAEEARAAAETARQDAERHAARARELAAKLRAGAEQLERRARERGDDERREGRDRGHGSRVHVLERLEGALRGDARAPRPEHVEEVQGFRFPVREGRPIPPAPAAPRPHTVPHAPSAPHVIGEHVQRHEHVHQHHHVVELHGESGPTVAGTPRSVVLGTAVPGLPATPSVAVGHPWPTPQVDELVIEMNELVAGMQEELRLLREELASLRRELAGSAPERSQRR